MNIYLFLTSLLLVVDLSCAISLVFIEKRDTTTTWAWLLILSILPFAGFILYMCFGQNISKEKIFSKKAEIDKNKLLKSLDNLANDSMHHATNEYLDLIKMNLNANGSMYTSGNSVKTYINGEDKFHDLFDDIKKAKHFINIEYYIFRYDNLGKSLIDLLRNKVEQGVEVRLLADGMGSKDLNKNDIHIIKSAGIKFAFFFPSLFSFINLRMNYRNHRKIVVIDGVTGYVGGFNVGDEYVNRGKQFSFWRDTHIRIQGNAVNELNKRFILDWEYAAKEDIHDKQHTKKHFNLDIKHYPPDIINEVGIQIVSSGPDNLEEYIRNSYLKIINNAKKNIFIQTPYLVLDDPMITALKLAASSGVDVRIMVPDKADHFFMAWALSASIGTLINSGVKFYKYKKGFIHAKTLVADSSVSSIGTANLDIRSFKLNFEINALIFDPLIARNNEAIFYSDSKDCHFLTLDEYKNRSRTMKILESLCRLIFPIL